MLFAVIHLAVAAVWLGSMAYSLVVVQPKVTRFFNDDSEAEDFLATLASGNRWPVVALITVLMLTSVGVIATSPRPIAVGYLSVLVFHAVAFGIFWYVSWRHWPARVFALPDELPRMRRQLRLCAWTMLALVATAFLIATSVSVGAIR
ncbi:MAG: hypothetical protein ACRDT8_02825 [Micromonosporaceae bacterium]